MIKLKQTENSRVRRLLQPVIVFTLLSVVAVTQAQTCDPEKPLTRPDSRYADNGDGTVTDHVTGLMWKQCAEGFGTIKTPCDCSMNLNFMGFPPCDTVTNQYTRSGRSDTFWINIHRLEEKNNTDGGYAGYNDWLVPSLEEMKSLQESACHSPAINQRYFPNTPPSYFWSSTLDKKRHDYNYQDFGVIVYFDYATVNSDWQYGYHYYRLVRHANANAEHSQSGTKTTHNPVATHE